MPLSGLGLTGNKIGKTNFFTSSRPRVSLPSDSPITKESDKVLIGKLPVRPRVCPDG
jgi:hypothetical protein